jgi:hypothetical protein
VELYLYSHYMPLWCRQVQLQRFSQSLSEQVVSRCFVTSSVKNIVLRWVLFTVCCLTSHGKKTCMLYTWSTHFPIPLFFFIFLFIFFIYLYTYILFIFIIYSYVYIILYILFLYLFFIFLYFTLYLVSIISVTPSMSVESFLMCDPRDWHISQICF